MPELSYRDAIRSTLIEEMDRDPTVVLLGEDIGQYQGTFRITADLLNRYGPKRVIDTAKVRYFSGGQVDVPLVIRGPNGAGVQLSAQHSQSLEAIYAHVPGLHVVTPATPAEAKGLLRTALHGKDP